MVAVSLTSSPLDSERTAALILPAPDSQEKFPLNRGCSDMSFSSMPTSDTPWKDIIVPGNSTNFLAHDSQVSPGLEQEPFDGLYECQQCGKHYTRLYDLNKHFRTYSRPFKCSFEDCRYHYLGWQSVNELDRHYSDKHSSEPRIFYCLWQSCTYNSKRESNCKQHMEKAHGWNHVHSRAGNRDEIHTEHAGFNHDTGHQPLHLRGSSPAQTGPNFFLTPSHLPQWLPAPGYTGNSFLFDGPMSYGSDVYIPWTSPVTSIGANQAYLEDFAQVNVPETPTTARDDHWSRVPVDPRLCNVAATSSAERVPGAQRTPGRDQPFKIMPTTGTPQTSPVVKTQVLTPVSEASPSMIQQNAFKREATAAKDVETRTVKAQSANQGLTPGNSSQTNAHGKRVRFSNEPENDSDNDDEPDIKRVKASDDDGEVLGDPKMICPFRVANPQIYDRQRHSKYDSCHTPHENISTVVRHLGRPAHNLIVDNARQAISSFNVPENEHEHPAAGLCKKCWRSFANQDAFEAHLSTKCENKSRSKREKFTRLLETFCGIERHHPSRTNSADGSNDPSEADDPEAHDAEGDVIDVPPIAPPPRNDDIVRRREHLALVQRVAHLERLLLSDQVRPSSQSTPRSNTLTDRHGAIAQAFTAAPANPSSDFGGCYSYSYQPGPPDPQPSMVPESNDHETGFYDGPERIIMTTPMVAAARRSDNLSTSSHRLSPAVGGSVSGPGNKVVDSLYGEAGSSSAVRVTAHPQRQVGHTESLGAVAGESSQESTNTTIRKQWERDLQAGNEILQSVDSFNYPGDDISKYLDMDSQ